MIFKATIKHPDHSQSQRYVIADNQWEALEILLVEDATTIEEIQQVDYSY